MFSITKQSSDYLFLKHEIYLYMYVYKQFGGHVEGNCELLI